MSRLEAAARWAARTAVLQNLAQPEEQLAVQERMTLVRTAQWSPARPVSEPQAAKSPWEARLLQGSKLEQLPQAVSQSAEQRKV